MHENILPLDENFTAIADGATRITKCFFLKELFGLPEVCRTEITSHKHMKQLKSEVYRKEYLCFVCSVLTLLGYLLSRIWDFILFLRIYSARETFKCQASGFYEIYIGTNLSFCWVEILLQDQSVCWIQPLRVFWHQLFLRKSQFPQRDSCE